MDINFTAKVEGDGTKGISVSGLAAPLGRVPGPDLLVEGVTSVEDRGVLAGMTFNRRHESDPTVTVLAIVPADEGLHPVPDGRQSSEAIHREAGHVLNRCGTTPPSQDDRC